MKSLFWISVFFIAYVYLGYPVWVYLRSRWVPRRWRQERITPTVSVVMVVHNEAEQIEQKLVNLFNLDYPVGRLEIVVVSDGSKDLTNAVLARKAEERLRVFQYPEHRGKAVALNLGIGETHGEIVVFTDVRQQLESSSVRFLVSNFADPSVGCVSGELVLLEEGQEGPLADVGLYWRYEKWIRRGEAGIDSTIGATGALYAVRRTLLTKLPEGTLLDDVYLPMHVVREGYRSVFDSRARAWDCLPRSNRGEFRRKVRTLSGNYQLLQMAPWLLSKENRVRFQFISHKLLRLGIPFLLASLFVSAWWLSAEPFYLGLALVQSAFYACAGLGLMFRARRLGKLLRVPAAFCLLNAAAVMGLINFLFHRRPPWQTWVPAMPGDSSKKQEW